MVVELAVFGREHSPLHVEGNIAECDVDPIHVAKPTEFGGAVVPEHNRGLSPGDVVGLGNRGEHHRQGEGSHRHDRRGEHRTDNQSPRGNPASPARSYSPWEVDTHVSGSRLLRK